MEKQPRYIGAKYSEEDVKGLDQVMEAWAKEAATPLEGELEKTEEETRMITVADDLIKKEIESLGIEGYESVDTASVHLLPTEVYRKHFSGNSGEDGFYRAVSHAIAVNKGATDTKPRLLATVTHELIHRASGQRFHRDIDFGVHESRVGYRVRSPWKEGGERKALTGFNEIIVETTNIHVLKSNQQLLEKEFCITMEDLNGPNYHYMEYSPVLAAVVAGLADYYKKTNLEVFKDLERGQFDNTLLVLKDLDKVFGKGSLEMLSYLGVLRDPRGCKEVDDLVQKYFETKGPQEKIVLQRTAQGLFGKYRMLEIEKEQQTREPES